MTNPAFIADRQDRAAGSALNENTPASSVIAVLPTSRSELFSMTRARRTGFGSASAVTTLPDITAVPEADAERPSRAGC